jgi:hypothetical protein
MGETCRMDWEMRNEYKVLDGKPEGKKHSGRPRCRWMRRNNDNLYGVRYVRIKFFY